MLQIMVKVNIKPGDELDSYKYVSVLSSLNNPKKDLINDVKNRLKESSSKRI